MPPWWLGAYDAPDPRGGALFAAYGVFVFAVLLFALGRGLARRGFRNKGWALVAANPVTVGLVAMAVRRATMDWAPMEFVQSCLFHPMAGWLGYAYMMSAGMDRRPWRVGLTVASAYAGLVLGGALLLLRWTHPTL